MMKIIVLHTFVFFFLVSTFSQNEYFNEEFKFKLDYPETWIQEPFMGKELFISEPNEVGIKIYTTFDVEIYRDREISVGDYYNLYLKEINDNPSFEDCSIISEKRNTLNGEDSLEILGRAEFDDYSICWRRIFIKHSEAIISLTATTELEKYKEAYKRTTLIFDSFKFIK